LAQNLCEQRATVERMVLHGTGAAVIMTEAHRGDEDSHVCR
jgi:hypothetical protein